MKIVSVKPKLTWIERAVETARFHASKIRDNPSWILDDTAKELRRSRGSISDDILIASWLKTHEHKLKEYKYAKDALAFIRLKRRQMLLDSLD